MKKYILIVAICIGAAALIGLFLRPPRISPISGPLNVLLITLDTTRADHLGCYGYSQAATAALDGLAAGGVTFDRAYCATPLTLPSHATMLTGVQPPEHGLRVNGVGRLSSGVPTLAEMLSSSGYRTGAFIASVALARNYGLHKGFQIYDDDMSLANKQDTQGLRPLAAYRHGDEIADAALRWLKTQADAPFFCWVHFYDPHSPYFTHAAQAGTRYAGQATYDSEIAFMDMQMKRLVGFLEQRDLRRRTLIIAVGDHGEGLGEHKEGDHGLLLYNSTLHVPLIFSLPGRLREGIRVAGTVSLTSLLPTVVDLLGLKAPEGITAASLKPALFGDSMDFEPCYGESNLPYADFGCSPLRSLTTLQWKYIRTPRPELYDLQADPKELNDLGASNAEAVAQLETQLAAIEEAMTHRDAEKISVSTEDLGRLAALGYLGGGSEPESDKNTWSSLPDVKDILPVFQLTQEMFRVGLHRQQSLVLELTREAVRRGPATAQFLRHIGDILYWNENRDEAINRYQEALRIDGEHTEAHKSLALALTAQGRFAEAIDHYIKALDKEPGSVQMLLNLGAALAKVGRNDEAIAACRQVLQIDPDYVPGQENLALLLFRQEKFAEAVDHFAKVVQQKPNDAETQYNLGVTLSKVNRNNDAITHLSEAVRLNPDYAEARSMLASLLTAEGRQAEADEHSAAAARLKPNSAEAHFDRGRILANEGKSAEAAVEFRESLRIKPENADAHLELGVALAKQGMLAEGMEHFFKAVQINPEHAMAHNNLGIALARQGKVGEALDHFSSALRIRPDYAEAHNNLGSLLRNQGRVDEAIAHFSEAVRLKPGMATARRNLEDALAHKTASRPASAPAR